MPGIKAENVFGESYGKTTCEAVGGQIKRGFELPPQDKYMSINQSKFTNQAELLRQQRPADVFEPGYDTISFVPDSPTKQSSRSEQKQITMNYQEARAKAFEKQ